MGLDPSPTVLTVKHAVPAGEGVRVGAGGIKEVQLSIEQECGGGH